MIHAKDARAIINNFLEEKEKQILELIDKKISETIQNGKYSISVSEDLSDKLIKKLEAFGYSVVSCKDPRDHVPCYTIKW